MQLQLASTPVHQRGVLFGGFGGTKRRTCFIYGSPWDGAFGNLFHSGVSLMAPVYIGLTHTECCFGDMICHFMLFPFSTTGATTLRCRNLKKRQNYPSKCYLCSFHCWSLKFLFVLDNTPQNKDLFMDTSAENKKRNKQPVTIPVLLLSFLPFGRRSFYSPPAKNWKRLPQMNQGGRGSWIPPIFFYEENALQNLDT